MTANPYSISDGSSGAFFSGDLEVIGFVDYLESGLAAEIETAIEKALPDLEEQFIKGLESNPDWSRFADSAYVTVKDGELLLGVNAPDAESLEYGEGRTPPNPMIRKSATKLSNALEDEVNKHLNKGSDV